MKGSALSPTSIRDRDTLDIQQDRHSSPLTHTQIQDPITINNHKLPTLMRVRPYTTLLTTNAILHFHLEFLVFSDVSYLDTLIVLCLSSLLPCIS